MLDNLKILRESKGYSQQQLANKIGMSQQSIYNYETNKTEPDIESLKKLADVFDVSLDYLVNRQKPGEDPNYPISKNEYLLIENIRKLDTATRNNITQIINQLADKNGRK